MSDIASELLHMAQAVDSATAEYMASHRKRVASLLRDAVTEIYRLNSKLLDVIAEDRH
jgi:hypothetical protein